MKMLAKALSIVTLSVMICAPLTARAIEKQPQIKGEVVMKSGNKVHMFHSGTADVKKEICINDVIPVYREMQLGGSFKSKEVGKVKVLSYVGEHYFEAQVVEGEIKPGDIAKKETASCLIQPIRPKK